MSKVTTGGVIQTALVSAFTIATALIWKDVIIEFIELVFPVGDQLFYKFMAAIFSTIIVVITIYIILRAQTSTEIVLRKLKKKQDKK